MEKLNGTSIKNQGVKDALDKYGIPQEVDEKAIFLLNDGEEDGNPRVLVAIVFNDESFGIKPYVLTKRADGKKYWYQRLVLTHTDLKDVESFIKNGGVGRMLQVVEERKAAKAKAAVAKEKAAQEKAAAKAKAAEEREKYKAEVKADVKAHVKSAATKIK